MSQGQQKPYIDTLSLVLDHNIGAYVEKPFEPRILYEDERLLIIDKPAGILTIPAPGGGTDLVSAINDWGKTRANTITSHYYPCHRLDRDTSGTFVLAKGKSTQKLVMELFSQRKTSKIYLCLVNGVLGKDSGSIKTPVDDKEALTQYQVLHRGANWTLLKCKILTGRTNQIRIHCASMGHPLIGDDKFGRRKEFALAAKRTLLHAWYLALPWSGSQDLDHVDGSRVYGAQGILHVVCQVPRDMGEIFDNHGIQLGSTGIS